MGSTPKHHLSIRQTRKNPRLFASVVNTQLSPFLSNKQTRAKHRRRPYIVRANSSCCMLVVYSILHKTTRTIYPLIFIRTNFICSLALCFFPYASLLGGKLVLSDCFFCFYFIYGPYIFSPLVFEKFSICTFPQKETYLSKKEVYRNRFLETSRKLRKLK